MNTDSEKLVSNQELYITSLSYINFKTFFPPFYRNVIQNREQRLLLSS